MLELEKKSGRAVLMGNEAIVRGALESGVQFVAVYPGTPSSEVGVVFSKIAENHNVYFEFSTNEKTALEAVVGASFSGLKCLAAMKNFGLNVASDALLPFCYTGTKGATVILVADDPSCHSSAQSEENSRAFAKLANIPILEPSTPDECREFVKLGFEISEKFKLPVIVRETTRVAHQRGIVNFKPLPTSNGKAGRFVKDKHRFLTMPPRVMEQHKELLEKIEKLQVFAEKSKVNYLKTGKNKKIGIITSGVSYLYVLEALAELKLDLPVLKLGFFHPLPGEKIKNFIKNKTKVLIVEELDPYLENEVNQLAKDSNPKLKVFGKELLPETGELKPDMVISAVAKTAGRKYSIPKTLDIPKIKHLPRFCTAPACPYWKLFAAVKQTAPKSVIFGGDIGCYMIAGLAPHSLYDYMSCMGSSIGIGHGIAKAVKNKQKVVAFMGDGTFFHAGMPALLNAVYNKSNLLVIIADNRITAMTGHQPNPGMGRTGMGDEIGNVKIEDIARAFKIKNIKVVDPEDDFNGLTKAIKAFLPKKEVSVIVSRRICALLAKRQARAKKK